LIISVSRRTDIPTFYSQWLANRVREGYCCVRNPFNAQQVSRISLDPSVVDCIVFWTKNPAPMLPRLDAFADYTYYFQFTLTGYGHDVEGNLPDKDEVLIPTFQRLAREIGPERVIWRYDPIAFTERYPAAYHLRAISKISERLEGCTERCVISFVDRYRRNARALDEMGVTGTDAGDLESQGILDFCEKLAGIASSHGMTVASCAEKADLSSVGVAHNACIDGELIARLVGAPLKVGKDRTQRPECGCVSSIDIGSYDTCDNGCRYCYANYSLERVRANIADYDPDSPLLCDALRPDDKVTDRAMASLVQQPTLPL
jgi:hypothetical protein